MAIGGTVPYRREINPESLKQLPCSRLFYVSMYNPTTTFGEGEFLTELCMVLKPWFPMGLRDPVPMSADNAEDLLFKSYQEIKATMSALTVDRSFEISMKQGLVYGTARFTILEKES